MEKFTEVQLAYMAGIVDGEGSVELKLQKSGTVDLVLHVYNSCYDLMQWMEVHFGGKVYDIHRRARVEKPQWQPVYDWNLTHDKARDLLEMLAPYMVIKRPQAELAVEAWDNRKPTPRGQRRWSQMDESVLSSRREYHDQMQALNRRHRGKKEAS